MTTRGAGCRAGRQPRPCPPAAGRGRPLKFDAMPYSDPPAIDMPELIAMCLECGEPCCRLGICDRIRNEAGRIRRERQKHGI